MSDAAATTLGPASARPLNICRQRFEWALAADRFSGEDGAVELAETAYRDLCEIDQAEARQWLSGAHDRIARRIRQVEGAKPPFRRLVSPRSYLNLLVLFRLGMAPR